jgi:hypothetical protein
MSAPAISPHQPKTKSRVAGSGISRPSQSATLTSGPGARAHSRPAALIATMTRSRSAPAAAGTGKPARSSPPVRQRAEPNSGAGAIRTP